MEVENTEITLRMPRLVGSLFISVMMGALILLFLGTALYIIFDPKMGLGLDQLDSTKGLVTTLLVTAGFVGWLLTLVLRDAHFKKEWQISLTKDGLHLDLPRWRSIHRVPAVHTQICFDDIEAIETRLEVYRRIGMTIILRAYALKLKSSDVIILGQDNVMAMASTYMYREKAIEKMSQYGNLVVHDLGMVIGKGGILNIIHTRTPKWDAPDLSPESQAKHWQRVEYTGLLTAIAPLLVFAAMMLQSFFS